MTLGDEILRYSAWCMLKWLRPHLAYTVKTPANDRCARCGEANCGCSDWQWNGSPPSAA